MKITKLAVGMTGVLVALGAAGFGAREFFAAGEAVEAQAVARRAGADVRAKIASLERKLEAETKRAAAVESDNAVLASAVQKVQTARVKPTMATVSRELLAERMKKALALAKDGDEATAMRELLWCYDTATARPELGEAAQIGGVVRALATLGERHPAALAALRERFEEGKRRVLGNSDDTEPVAAMGLIARALKDEQAMGALYDAIPAEDARRRIVAIFGAEDFITTRRYSDVLVGRSYGAMSSSFEMGIRELPLPGATAERLEKIKALRRSYAVTSAAKNIEVLAGAGDLVHARELAGRVLAYDGTEATRALLQKHLERAGQPGLLATEGGK